MNKNILGVLLFIAFFAIVQAAECGQGEVFSAGICVPTDTEKIYQMINEPTVPQQCAANEILDATGACRLAPTTGCGPNEVQDANGICRQVPTNESDSTFTGKTTTGAKVGGIIPSGGSSGSGLVKIPNPLGVNTFADLIAKINKWLLIISVPIFTLMIFIGAFQLMTGAGNPEKITQGRHTITWAIIGYALLLLSTGITEIIKNVLGAK